ncbi:MAG: Hsp20/alpha crystallin family protein [Candidatus Nanohaloarchaea archaeon]|nr:Hsp20/alpha crystallin family protein [Candidatus Nanohaloarchaea archaeon]
MRRRRGNPFRRMMERMNQMMESMPETGIERFEEPQLPIDMQETDSKIKVKADMPGVDKDNIQVRVKDGTLQIQAQNDREVREEGKDYIRHERSTKQYSRAITLPSEVDETSAEANYENGVLTVTLDKQESDTDYSVDIQ